MWGGSRGDGGRGLLGGLRRGNGGGVGVGRGIRIGIVTQIGDDERANRIMSIFQMYYDNCDVEVYGG